MPPAAPRRRPIQRAAIVLISVCAVAGVLACLLGALRWGLIGLTIGLIGSWTLFLLGLFSLYRRERHQVDAEESLPAAAAAPARLVEPSATPAKLP